MEGTMDIFEGAAGWEEVTDELELEVEEGYGQYPLLDSTALLPFLNAIGFS